MADLEQMKRKYQSVLQTTKGVQLTHLHIQDSKLFIGGVAPSEQAKNDVWNAIKAVDPSYNDLTPDITLDTSPAQASASPGSSPGQSGKKYTVKPGDSLSKISKEIYGSAGEYMKIFEANRDKLESPDKIQPGQELTIPS